MLHVFTDFQQSGLAWSEVDELPEDVESHLHDLGRSAVNNLAVTEARPERAWLRPDEQTSLHVTVYNGGPFNVDELPIVLKLANQGREITLREQLKIEPGTVESLRLDLPPLAAGLWQGTLAIETDDDLPADNSRHVAAVGFTALSGAADRRSRFRRRQCSARRISCIRLCDLRPKGNCTRPARMSRDRSWPVIRCRIWTRSMWWSCPTWGTNSKRATAANWRTSSNAAAGLLVFCGENVTAERAEAMAAAGLTVGQIGGIQHAVDLPLRLATWDSKHPIFAAFSDPQLGDLARLSFTACTKITPDKDAQVLAKFKDGTPAVIEKKLGKGSVVWFASTADRRWSDWTRSRLYLPLVYQLLGHQSGLSAGGRVRDEILEAQATALLPGQAIRGLPTELPPGVHSQDDHTLVVNGGPREAETDRAPLEEFANRFGLKLDRRGDSGGSAAQRARRRGDGVDRQRTLAVARGLLARRAAGRGVGG